MTDSGPSAAHGRQPSDVLNAILDAVVDSSPNESSGEPYVFRDRAHAQVDISRQIDNLLPITTPKLWIAIAGAAVLLVAGGVYAAGTPSVTSVATVGRVVPASGVVRVESSVDMGLEKIMVAEGTDVRQGEVLGAGSTATGQPIELRSAIDGTVWQVLASPGQALAVGEALLTLLPAGSKDTVLVPVEEAAARGIQAGQRATIADAGLKSAGVVAEVPMTPLSGPRASEMTGLPLNPSATYVLVPVTTNGSPAYGAVVDVEIIESESNLLSELVNLK